MNPTPKTRRALVTVTGTTFQDVVPAASGYAYAISQISMHNGSGDIRNLNLYEDNERFFTYTLGASGTIIQDMDINEQFHTSSGIRANLDGVGLIDVSVRYVLIDNRTPVNLNPLTYLAQTTRCPNRRGQQQEGS